MNTVWRAGQRKTRLEARKQVEMPLQELRLEMMVKMGRSERYLICPVLKTW